MSYNIKSGSNGCVLAVTKKNGRVNWIHHGTSYSAINDMFGRLRRSDRARSVTTDTESCLRVTMGYARTKQAVKYYEIIRLNEDFQEWCDKKRSDQNALMWVAYGIIALFAFIILAASA